MLTEKEEKKRQMILNGNVLKVLLYLSLPIIIYNGFNYFYTVIDGAIVSKKVSNDAVSSVYFFDQIKNMISSIGLGLATGGSVLIARMYGANKIEDAKKATNSIFWLNILISLIVIVIVVPLAKPILILSNASEAQINNGLGYFIVQVLNLLLVSMNTYYMGIERVKGNTLRLFYLNLLVIVIKIGLTFVVVSFPNPTTTHVALATLAAQFVLFVVSLFIMGSKKNSLRLTFKIDKSIFSKELLKPTLKISFPIFLGKFIFSFGKVIVSSMSKNFYGDAIIGALGIAGTMGGLSSIFYNSVADVEISMMSQSFANDDYKRGFEIVKKTFISVLIVTSITMIFLTIFYDSVVKIFINEETTDEYYNLIKLMFKWERFSSIFIGLTNVLLNTLYAFGKTMASIVLNFCRLIIFRIPVLLFLYYVLHIQEEAAGIVMFISNGLLLVIMIIIFYIFKHKLKIQGKL